jgi:hypothetical protein
MQDVPSPVSDSQHASPRIFISPAPSMIFPMRIRKRSDDAVEGAKLASKRRVLSSGAEAAAQNSVSRSCVSQPNAYQGEFRLTNDACISQRGRRTGRRGRDPKTSGTKEMAVPAAAHSTNASSLQPRK